MAAWRGRVQATALSLAAAGALVAVGNFRGPHDPQHGGHSGASTVFAVPLQGGGSGATAAPAAVALRQLGTGTRQRAPHSEAPEAGASTLAAAAAALLAFGAVCAASGSGRQGSSRLQRRATTGVPRRDYASAIDRFGYDMKTPKPAWIPGQWGFNTEKPNPKPLPGPARQAKARVTDPMATFLPTDFYMSEFAELKSEGVREVGTYMVAPGTSDIVTPAKLPEYKRPRTGLRLEKEPGQKRTPMEDGAYTAYVDKGCTLAAAAAKQSVSMDKDFIADRSALTLLLDYLSENLSHHLRQKGQYEVDIDFVKVSKVPGSKALALERVYQQKNLWAEFRPYNGGWRRSEVSQNGTYSPAWERLATGDMTKSVMITGLQQIAGVRAGAASKRYRFVEYDLGGLSFLTRAPTHCSSEGKSVELKHKNEYYKQQLTILKAYYELLLGGVDLQSVALQRSGKITKILEVTLDGLLKKQPGVVEAAERRLGRLAEMLKKVKSAVEAGGDGPWVLQWQRGELVLGKYELPEPEPEEEEEKAEEKVEVEA